MEESYELMWTEKYRPKTLDEIINQKENVEKLKGFVKVGSIPHLLFSGPPGTGKTTTVLALANDLLGREHAKQNILELNASDDRGINIVRNEIKDFARTAPYGGAPFKLIVLDEADSLTTEAQHALRRTMEKYVKTSRFVLLCNYPSKIIEPIQSRCAIFRFTPLKKEDVIQFLLSIVEKENVRIEERAIELVYEVSRGDMRKAINILQTAASTQEKITTQMIYHAAGLVHPKELEDLLKNALEGKFKGAREKLLTLILKTGFSGQDIIRQISSEIPKLDIEDGIKLKIMDMLAEIDFRIAEGASEDIQLTWFLAKLAAIKHASK